VNLIYGRRDITTNFTSFSYFTEDSLDTLGVTPKYILEKNIFGRTNKLILGLDYYRDTLDKDTFNNRAHSLKTLVAEMSRESLGGYVRDEFSILKELILALGYRYERAKIDGNETDLSTGNPTFDSEKTHKAQAYEAALTYLFGEKSKAFAKYASTYRIPLLDEQIILTGYLPATFNIDLEKETGKSYELGTLFYPVKDLKLGLTLYRIDMEDEINYDNLGRLVNLDKTRHQGIELSLSYLVKNVFPLYGNCTFQDVEFRDGVNNGNEVPLVPRQMANMGVEVYLPYNFSLRPEVRYVGKQYSGGDYDNNLEQLDNYTLYDIFLFYKPQFGRDRVTAFVGIENLTDENYATIGYDFFTQVVYYPSPGITFKGGLSVSF
jgi:iron complex outermembrane receptor protein